MDLFKKYLNDNNNQLIRRALIDSSYKNIDKSCKEDNSDLATIGDRVLSLCLTIHFYNEKKNDPGIEISEVKKKYEENGYLVNPIAKKYHMLKYIRRDTIYGKMKKNYKYINPNNKSNNPWKYIATAVEAVIGAIYLSEREDLEVIKMIVENWIK